MRHALDCGMCCGLQVCDCGAEPMTEERATAILAQNQALSDDGGLHSLGWYLSWNAAADYAVLDGEFAPEHLEAIAWWMRNKAKARQPVR